MNFCRHILRPGRVVATLAGLSVAWSATAGDAIRFSKPAIALAAPPKVDKDLPDVPARSLDFSNPELEQGMMAPPRPPPPMMRREPRGPNRDEERDTTPRMLRTPKIFTDPDEEKARKEALAKPFGSTTEKQKPSPFMRDMETQMRSEQTRGLSPVTQFDWEPGDPAHGRKETKRGGMGASHPYARNDDLPFGAESGRPDPIFNFSDARPQEKPTPSQLQRRTDFEQLLNPNTGLAGKGPDSMQPVVNATAKPGSLAIPTVGPGRFDPRSSDPMSAYNQQNERLRGPVVEDINKRYNPPVANPSGGSKDQGSQAPLRRQPISRDFPTRTF